jgi:hypothetical protein
VVVVCGDDQETHEDLVGHQGMTAKVSYFTAEYCGRGEVTEER